MKKFAFILIIFISMASPGDTASGDDVAGKYFLENVVEKKLPNGITLLMINRGYSPTLSLRISFRVGSADESYNSIGAAHILEHMLFKGTEKLGTKDFKGEKKILRRIEAVGETLDRLKLGSPGNSAIAELEKELKMLQKMHEEYIIGSPYDRIYTEIGGIGLNASTSKDITGYYIQLPADKIETWAEIESERIQNPVLREYYKERDNIIEERLMRTDSSGNGLLSEAFFAAAFQAHPYRHPVIGWASNIKYMSIHDIRRFYRDHYIPSRMTITIVGKQDTDETCRIVNKYFSNIESRPATEEVKIIEPPQKGEKRVDVFFKSRPFLIMGWKKPAAPDPVDTAFDVISTALGDGKSSRLYKSLVLDKKIASAVYTWNGAPGVRYDNMFLIYAAPAEGVTPEDLEKEIIKEINLFRESVTEDELQRVKSINESSFLFMMDSNESIAGTLSYYETVLQNWRYLAGYTDRLNRISGKDVKNAIDTYMTDKNRTVGILRDSRGEK
jgi:predicted Zn-dependent peptidase